MPSYYCVSPKKGNFNEGFFKSLLDSLNKEKEDLGAILMQSGKEKYGIFAKRPLSPAELRFLDYGEHIITEDH